MDVPSGQSADLFYADYSAGARAWNRTLTYSSATSYSAGDATINGATTNTGLVPLKIVGYK